MNGLSHELNNLFRRVALCFPMCGVRELTELLQESKQLGRHSSLNSNLDIHNAIHQPFVIYVSVSRILKVVYIHHSPQQQIFVASTPSNYINTECRRSIKHH